MVTEPSWVSSRRPPKDRAFLSDEPAVVMTRDGVQGLELSVRLTSYRSLPLSCIEAIELRVDGQSLDMSGSILTVGFAPYRYQELAQRSDVFWFVLDYARLFVPTPASIAVGSHEIEGTLVTVEPYMTAGRFSFYNASKKTVVVEASSQESVL